MKPLLSAMMIRDDYTFPIVAAGLVVIVLFSVPSVSSILHQLSKGEKKSDEIYEDEDGKATAESVKAFSAKVPKTSILLFAAVGLGLSLALGILSTSDEDLGIENWLSVAGWVCFLPSCPFQPAQITV